MNNIYRVIWNKSTQTFQAVCEYAKAQGKGGQGATGEIQSPVKSLKSTYKILTLSIISCLGIFTSSQVMAADAVCVDPARLTTSPIGTVGDATAAGDQVACGQGAVATGINSIAIGATAKAVKTSDIAIGEQAYASGGPNNRTSATAVGFHTTAQGTQALALGSKAQAIADQSVAIGNDTFASGWGAYSIGGDDTDTAGGVTQADGTANPLYNGYHRKDAGGERYRQSASIGVGSVVVGVHAQALSNGSTALGMGALAGDGGIGKQTDIKQFVITSNIQATAIGTYANAKSQFSTAIGKSAQAGGGSATAIGDTAKALTDASVAIGRNAVAGTVNTALAGEASNAKIQTIAIGDGAQATGNQSISIGTGNKVSGDSSGAFGDPSIIAGAGSYSVGNDNHINANTTGGFILGSNNQLGGTATYNTGDKLQTTGALTTTTTANGSTAVGSRNYINSENTFVIGNDVNTKRVNGILAPLTNTIANSVYLGNQSTAVKDAGTNLKTDGTAGTTTTAGATGTFDSITFNPTSGGGAVTFDAFAGKTAVGAVSVGASGAERRIQNVAAGQISSTSTDAINGSQLYAIAHQVADLKVNLASGAATGPSTDMTYFHVNTESVASPQPDGNASTNSGEIASKAGATGSYSVTAGLDTKAYGDYATALGSKAEASMSNTTAVGYNAKAILNTNVTALGANSNASAEGAVALGAYSNADRTGFTAEKIAPFSGVDLNGQTTGAVSVGGADANNSVKLRQIINVGDGTEATDAVNVRQLQAVADIANKGFKITADDTTALPSGATTDDVKLGETVKYTSTDGNIITKVTDNTIDFGLKDQVTFGDTTTDGKITLVGANNGGAAGPQIDLGVQQGVKYLGDDAATQPNRERLTVDGTQVATMEDGLAFAGNTANTTINKKLNETLTIKGGLANSADATAANTRVDIENGNMIVKMAKDLTDLSSATFTTGSDIVKVDGTGMKFVDSAGTQVTNTPSITKTGIDAGNQQITGVASAGDITATANANNAVNAGDLNTAVSNVSSTLTNKGFKITADDTTALPSGATTDDVKLGETVKYTSTDGNIITKVTDNTIDFGLKDQVTFGDTTTDGKITLVGANNGGAAGPQIDLGVQQGVKYLGDDAATQPNRERLTVDGTQVATMEDGLAFAGNTANTTINKKLNETLTIKGGLANSADATAANTRVDIENGNMIVKMAKDLTDLSSATFGTGNDKTVINKDGITITNGTNPATAISLTDAGLSNGGNAITNVKSGLSNYGSTGANANLLDLSVPATGSPTVANSTVATVGDLRNMGWVVSAPQTAGGYAETVKNANEVKFVGTGLATVSGETAGNTRTITVNVNAQAVTDSAQLPVVYTKADGTRVYKVDGKFYTTPTPNLDPAKGVVDSEVVAGDIITSVQNADGSTTKPATLANVASNLPATYNTTVAPDGSPVTVTTAQAVPNITDSTQPGYVNVNNAATVGDVLNAGFNLQNNGDAKDFVKAYDTVNFADGSNTKAVVTTDGTTNKIQINVTGLPVTYTNAAGTPVVKVGDKYYTVDSNGNPTTTVVPADQLVTNLVNPTATPGTIGKPTSIGNISSGLVTYGSVAAPTPAASSLVNLGNTAVKDSTVATVGDLRNMGWVVSAPQTKNGYAVTVKNADQVDFVGADGIVVTGETKDGKRVITIKGPTVTAGNNVTVTQTNTTTGATGGTTSPTTGTGGTTTTSSQPANYVVATKDDLTLNSVTIKPVSGSTIIAGINAGGTTITNVAPGDISSTSTDAVNGSQLYALTGGNSSTTVIGSNGSPLTDANGNPIKAVTENVSVNVINPATGMPQTDANGNVVTETTQAVLMKTYNVNGQTNYVTNSAAEAIYKMNEQGIKFFHTNDGTAIPKVETSNTVDSSASGIYSTAIGYQSKAEGTNSIAFGKGAQASADNSIAIGTGNVVKAHGSGAIGDPNYIGETDGGQQAKGSEKLGTYIIGNDNGTAEKPITTKDTFILGNNVTETKANSVFLGKQTASFDQAGSTRDDSTGVHVAAEGSSYTYAAANEEGVAGKNNAVGVVSVGNATETRQVQGVAAGVVSANSTDAINGSQLYYTNEAITNLGNTVYDLGNKLSNRIDDVEDGANAGVSSAMAMAALPQAYIPGKSMLTGGIASYNGEGAVAVGFSKLSDNGRWVLKMSGSADTQGNAGAAVGAGFHF